MTAQYRKAIFIFRRDLRLDDNTGLMAALEQSRVVIPCFILDPRQIDIHPYRSEHALQFMLESLEDLDAQIRVRGGRLYLFSGYPHEIVERLVHREQVDAVFVNRDYTPFSIMRDETVADVCDERNVAFHQYADLLLTESEAVCKLDGSPYTVYTPFAKKARTWLVPEPQEYDGGTFFTGPITEEDATILNAVLPNRSQSLFARGGSSEATMILQRMEQFSNYRNDRDFPALDGTTGLSAHLKFGTVSIRRTYTAIARAMGEGHELIRQLYWRDFFTHIAYHFPNVFGHSFYQKYDSIIWSNDKAAFQRWCEGTTGFPIIDAGVRQLNETGWMHNRGRMITASFLVKDLHIDWRWGEKYFAQKLVDYDPSVNNGNWQWVASTGCDATPYFRIFNPWLQQKKYDPDCLYIKRWVPELRDISPATIHGLDTSVNLSLPGYPNPMLDHRVESEKTRQMFAAINQISQGDRS